MHVAHLCTPLWESSVQVLVQSSESKPTLCLLVDLYLTSVKASNRTIVQQI